MAMIGFTDYPRAAQFALNTKIMHDWIKVEAARAKQSGAEQGKGTPTGTATTTTGNNSQQ